MFFSLLQLSVKAKTKFRKKKEKKKPFVFGEHWKE